MMRHEDAEALGQWLPRGIPEQADCGDELEVVREMFGADFAELAMLYRNDGPPRITALHQAGAARDYAQVAKVAHAFNGSSRSIGATGLAALCKDLEMCAKAKALDDFAERLTAIEAEYSRINGKLQMMCPANIKTT